MPKVLIYKGIWIFVIFDTDLYENKKHVHVGKKATFNLCKIWIEPQASIEEPGDLTIKQQNEVCKIAEKYKDQLTKQWDDFMKGKTIKAINVK